MAGQLGGPCEKFVDWRQYAAVMPSPAKQRLTAASPQTFQTALVYKHVRECSFNFCINYEF
jgi:hypothetical protein